MVAPRSVETFPISRAVVLVLLLAACSDPAPQQIEPLSEPTRTATQDEALRRLMLQAGESKLCQQVQGKLLPLTGSEAVAGPRAGKEPALGRLWVDRCEAETGATGLRLKLAGKGWTWVDERRQGPLGSSFEVKGYLRFEVETEMNGVVDLGFAESEKVLSVWYTPRGTPMTRMKLIGSIPVSPATGWSGIIGTVGQMLSGPLDEQARPVVLRYGAAMISQRLSRGVTVTSDLCTGQIDTLMAALSDGQVPERPYSDDGQPWIENQRLRLHPGGVDIAGAWETGEEGLYVDVEVEAGSPVIVRALCRADGERVLQAYLRGTPAPIVTELLQRQLSMGHRARLTIPEQPCEVMLLFTPSPREQAATTLRYRVVRRGEERTPILDCSDQS